MEARLAALHGFTLPTYKRPRGQPRADDPCPNFFLKTPAKRLKSHAADVTVDWTAQEAALFAQRRGLQYATAAASPDAPEWTPQQRQQFLELLKTRRQDAVEGRTICDCDRLLAELFNASQRGKTTTTAMGDSFIYSSLT